MQKVKQSTTITTNPCNLLQINEIQEDKEEPSSDNATIRSSNITPLVDSDEENCFDSDTLMVQ